MSIYYTKLNDTKDFQEKYDGEKYDEDTQRLIGSRDGESQSNLSSRILQTQEIEMDDFAAKGAVTSTKTLSANSGACDLDGAGDESGLLGVLIEPESSNASGISQKRSKFLDSKSKWQSFFPKQTPWNNMNGTPINNSLQVQLIYDIAGYLMMYGAPLYRVQHRLKNAAEAFQLQVSAFFLPSDLFITVESKTSFLSIPSNLNMHKLERVDKLAKDLIRLLAERRSASVVSISSSMKASEDTAYYEFERQLSEVVKDESNELHPVVRLLSASLTCSFLLMLCFKGNVIEGIVVFVLGGLAFWLNLLASRFQLHQGAPIFISFLISLICGIIQVPQFWQWADSPGLCAEYVIIVSLIPFMPGSQFALGMLEFTSLPVSSLVRLFLAFMRSFQIGYGITMGSRVAEMILNWHELVGDKDFKAGVCPKSDEMKTFDAWRLMFLFPMLICIMVLYRAHKSQYPMLLLSTLTCFTVSAITKSIFSIELSIVLSGLALGIVANSLARWNQTPAIPAIYCGIFWLLPGGLGFSGSANLISGVGGADFGLNIMLRTLSMSIGLYAANIIVFPFSKRIEAQDETLAI